MSIQKLYQKAKEAYDRKNYPYALNAYGQILGIQPDSPEALVGLLHAAEKNNEVHGAPKAFGLKMLQVKLTGFKTVKKWDKLMAGSVEGLQKYPTAPKLLLMLGEAADGGGHINLAVEALERAVNFGIKGADKVFFQLAKKCDELGELRKAMGFVNQARRANPTNHEIVRYQKQLDAKISMDEGGWEEAAAQESGGYRKVLKDEQKAVEMDQTERILRTKDDVEQALVLAQKELDQKPDDIRLLRKMGELYARKRDFKQAQNYYQKALDINPQDSQTASKLGDLKVLIYEKNIEILKAKVKKEPGNTEFQKKLKQNRQGLLKFKIIEGRRRVKAQPTDMGLRYLLGEYLMSGGLVDDAIAEFQASIKDPKRKTQSIVQLGKCFVKKKMFDAAKQQFETVVNENANMNAMKKEAYYCLGDCMERAGNKEESLHYFQQVFQADIKFKDVTKRIDKLNAG